MNFFQSQGVTLEAYYPYTAGDQNRSGRLPGWDSNLIKIQGYSKINGIEAIKEYVATKGPVEACFTVYQDFYNYRSGVYRYTTGSILGGHCVCIVAAEGARLTVEIQVAEAGVVHVADASGDFIAQELRGVIAFFERPGLHERMQFAHGHAPEIGDGVLADAEGVGFFFQATAAAVAAFGVGAVAAEEDADVHLVGIRLQPAEVALHAVPQARPLMVFVNTVVLVAINDPALVLSRKPAERHVHRHMSGLAETGHVTLRVRTRADLLLGDGPDSKIKLVVNGGTNENAFMTAVKPEYPEQAIDISYFASTYSIDVNNDGGKDLIAVHNNTRDGQSKQHIWLYINEGQTCAPIFKLFTKSWLADDMFYFCAASSPALSDVNGDGLVDVLVGGHVVKTDTDYENRLILLLKIGTPDLPTIPII